MDIIKQLENLTKGKIIKDANLKDYTTYKQDGIADIIVFPISIEELKAIVIFLKKNQIKNKVI